MLYPHIVSKEPIRKGWSGDTKYRVVLEDGRTCLLRISPDGQKEKKLAQFRHMEQAAALGIPMCLPLEFGDCEEGVYSLQSWIEGQDAEDIIPSLSPERQYAYGMDAGILLRKLHTLPAPANVEGWAERFDRKIDRKLRLYRECPLQYEHGERFLNHIAKARHLLTDRPQTYQHGDYHIGNMMIDKNGILTVIDFDRDDYGDPWEEFNRIVWSAQAAPHFAAGMVDGYFDKNVPTAFWELLALYISCNSIGSLPWAIPYGEDEVNVMRRQAQDILTWYDNLNTTTPIWYRMK